MDSAFNDKRFAHVAKDPRFRSMPRKDRKVKIDKRFQGMFTDDRFKLKYTVDRKGRKTNKTTDEDLKRFYELSDESDDDDNSKSDSESEGEAQKEKGKKNKPVTKKPVGEKYLSQNSADNERTDIRYLQKDTDVKVKPKSGKKLRENKAETSKN